MNWNLGELFANEAEFSAVIDSASAQARDFELKFKDRLHALSAEEFLGALELYESISEQIGKIMSFAHLRFARDTSLGAQQAKTEQACNDISQSLLFFELEFNELDAAKQDEFIAGGGRFRYYLSLLKQRKAHQLSLPQESVLLKTSPVSGEAFSRLFDESMARMSFDFRGRKLGEEEILSLLHSSDREVRKDAAASLSAVLEQNSHLLGYIYNMIKTDLKIRCELRGYDKAEAVMHEENQINIASVDALIAETERSFTLVGKFYAKKREILGYDALYDYDRYAPLGGDESEFSFEQAKQIVLAAFEKFSPKFKQIALIAFERNWIDAMPAQNKQSGAFSHSGSRDTHPFVLLNFTRKRRDVFTLAHELGHAIHQYLSYGVGYFNSFTPLTTAETASVFCEMLVFDYMRENFSNLNGLSNLKNDAASDGSQNFKRSASQEAQGGEIPNERAVKNSASQDSAGSCELAASDTDTPSQTANDKAALRAMLAAKIEDIFATLYRQIGFTTFERRVHASADELSTGQIDELWMEESRKMFAGELILQDHYKSWWSYIPHFIHSPFYCYSYAYAQLLVLALYGLYKSGRLENFVQIYTEFLSSGGSDAPQKLVAKFGFDINKSEFWRIGIEQVAALVDEFVRG
ncbi:M3 family oligoendopeptidase [uncultured Campylobacter sp.]|uniref:M3 family oligoendopeptidase n=1 Tax=uncultured Campylobacter sp. TaxID=218934 RepID=UPI0026287CFE|nr:M3 family oligoendopeptidase [uncultured Campylobacter sp.]